MIDNEGAAIGNAVDQTDAENSKMWPGLAVLLLLALWPTASTGAPLTGDRVPTHDGDLIIHPINHATLALQWKDRTIYVDPVGGAKRFEGLPHPELILITDIHGDHMDAPTLSALVSAKTAVIAPKEVAEKLPEPVRKLTTVLTNGENQSLLDVRIESVPMYNTTPDRLKFHSRGRGNGYVLTLGGTRVYISGDTEDIPEMRALKNIDVAFICMNLPYTMTAEQAASAVREFKPRLVYPYHYRGTDTEKFKELVGKDSGVEVRLRDWYK